MTLDLSEAPTVLVRGANGQGKSLMFTDCVFFALFGKPFRNINKPQLINSINKGDTLVTLDFQIGSIAYKVERGLKPNIFNIYKNGQLLELDGGARDLQTYFETVILRMTEASFRQIVILGSASYIPFMRLPVAHRREVIEDLLDISVFSSMLALAKTEQAEAQAKFDLLTQKMQSAEQVIRLEEDFERREALRAQEDTTEKITNQQKVLDSILIEGRRFSGEKKEIDAEIVEATASLGALELPVASHTIKSDIRVLEHQIKQARTDISYVEKNPDCPACKQNIPHAHKSNLKETLGAKITEAEAEIKDLQVKLAAAEAQEKLIAQAQSALQSLRTREAVIMSSLKTLSASHKEATAKLEALKTAKPATSPSRAHVDLDKLRADYEALKSEKSVIAEAKSYSDVCLALLKDGGIKTKIIKRYLPTINKHINQYLKLFGLNVNFELDEMFNETIKSRYRDSFSYNSFSEGERQRIDLALMFTWRDIAKMKSTTSTNLLVMDEVFDSSLDGPATDQLIEIINEIAGSDTNVFVISHKNAELTDKFANQIEIGKVGNFSKITRRDYQSIKETKNVTTVSTPA